MWSVKNEPLQRLYCNQRKSPSIVRTIALAYKNKKILPIASRCFMNFILERYDVHKPQGVNCSAKLEVF